MRVLVDFSEINPWILRELEFLTETVCSEAEIMDAVVEHISLNSHAELGLRDYKQRLEDGIKEAQVEQDAPPILRIVDYIGNHLIRTFRASGLYNWDDGALPANMLFAGFDSHDTAVFCFDH